METKQFYDKPLAHASYAVVSDGEMALVDPGRDPKPYLDFARQHNAKIVAVFETHPHADFISSHLEFYEKYGANIYINSEAGVSYPHKPMNDGDEVRVGQVTMRALFTPGHSPDHNAYILLDEQGNPYAVYTGDALFVGDVGRPDLREGAGNVRMKRKELAHLMFRTIRDVFETLEDDVWVYPAHGAGSLCGKSMRAETYSTLGREKKQNWAFQVKAEEDFKRALHIPLFELRERVREVKTDRPLVVHCAGGYRSAIGSSLLQRPLLDTKVYDLGEALKNFQFLPHKPTLYEG